jgi:peptidyl-prolyl cis-trans isomerase A (cyclophilin A)
MRLLSRLVTAPLVVLSLIGCPRDTPPEPEPSRPDPLSSPYSPTPTPAPTKTPVPTPTDAPTPPPPEKPSPTAAVQPTPGDPVAGKWAFDDATKDLKGDGPLSAKIDTSKGAITCKLYDDKAPITVANFVGLARGLRPFKDPKKPGSNEWVKRPFYDGTTFHRIIKGFMIQGGDPLGTGSGEPGYVIPDELWQGAKHDRAGLLCMANRGHNTNGAQFFITDAAAAHLDGNYTIFGECTPEQTVHDIAGGETLGDRAKTPVTIKTVTISRQKAK